LLAWAPRAGRTVVEPVPAGENDVRDQFICQKLKHLKNCANFHRAVANNSSTDESINNNPPNYRFGAAGIEPKNRLKQCMALVKSILDAEPENKEALRTAVLIRSYLEQDLAKARTMVEEARLKNQRRLFAPCGIMLHTILEVDQKTTTRKEFYR